MRDDKRKFYCEGGAVRSSRSLDKQVEKMVLEKQDADAFLSVLAPEFKGVYFVDLDRDTVRHLYIPFYFEKILKETGDVFMEMTPILTVQEEYTDTDLSLIHI